MTSPIQTTTVELEEVALSEDTQGTRNYPVSSEGLPQIVAPPLEQNTTRHALLDTPVKHSSEGYIEAVQNGHADVTSSEAPISRAGEYILKQKWEGHVLHVGSETFRAQLTPLVGDPGEHIADIYLSEVDRAERELVEPGSVFYWSIGYRDTISGRRRESFIRFQRLPPRSDSDLRAARQRGRDLFRLLGGE